MFSDFIVYFPFADHEKKLSLQDWLSPVIAKPLIISIGLMIFQQLSGVAAVVFNVSLL